MYNCIETDLLIYKLLKHWLSQWLFINKFEIYIFDTKLFRLQAAEKYLNHWNPIARNICITSPNLWFFGIQISSSDESRGSSKTNLNEGRRQIAQADKISGTSARRQADPRDGIKFSFGERSRVTNYTYIHPFLPSTTRQIDFRPTMMPGFSSLETARAIRPPLRASPSPPPV